MVYPLVIVIGCIIFLSTLLDVIRCYKDVSDVITVSFLEQLDPGILFLPYDFDLNWFHSRVKSCLLSLGSVQ